MQNSSQDVPLVLTDGQIFLLMAPMYRTLCPARLTLIPALEAHQSPGSHRHIRLQEGQVGGWASILPTHRKVERALAESIGTATLLTPLKWISQILLAVIGYTAMTAVRGDGRMMTHPANGEMERVAAPRDQGTKRRDTGSRGTGMMITIRTATGLKENGVQPSNVFDQTVRS